MISVTLGGVVSFHAANVAEEVHPCAAETYLCFTVTVIRYCPSPDTRKPIVPSVFVKVTIPLSLICVLFTPSILSVVPSCRVISTSILKYSSSQGGVGVGGVGGVGGVTGGGVIGGGVVPHVCPVADNLFVQQ